MEIKKIPFKFYFITCDESNWICPITSLLYNKYCLNPNIIFLGYNVHKTKLPDNVLFKSMGKIRDRKKWLQQL